MTDRIMRYTDKFYNETGKSQNVIGHNFRVNHNMREHVLSGLKENVTGLKIELCLTDTPVSNNSNTSEADVFYWKKTVRRHNPEFYKMLNEKLLFMTFGGYFEYKPFAYQPYGLAKKIARKFVHFYAKYLVKTKQDIAPAHFIFQHDNFRFWEVLYSGSCPINLNFESWNFMLPVNPVEGIHYLGIKDFNFKDFSERLSSLSEDEIKKIGIQGRRWVAENYSPVAQAERVIRILDALSR